MGRNGRLFVSNTTVAVPRGFVTMCHHYPSKTGLPAYGAPMAPTDDGCLYSPSP